MTSLYDSRSEGFIINKIPNAVRKYNWTVTKIDSKK